MIWHVTLSGGPFDRFEGWPHDTDQPGSGPSPVIIAYTENGESRLSSDIENPPEGAVEYRLAAVDLDRRAARYEVLGDAPRSVVERVAQYTGGRR